MEKVTENLMYITLQKDVHSELGLLLSAGVAADHRAAAATINGLKTINTPEWFVLSAQLMLKALWRTFTLTKQVKTKKIQDYPTKTTAEDKQYKPSKHYFFLKALH